MANKKLKKNPQNPTNKVFPSNAAKAPVKVLPDLNTLIGNKALAIAMGIIIILSIIIYKPILSGDQSVFVYKDIGSDSYNLFYPMLSHVSKYLRTEGIPKWSFNQGMGQNVFPGESASINDPFNLFIFCFSPDNLPYALVWAQVLKIISGGLIFFLYLRT